MLLILFIDTDPGLLCAGKCQHSESQSPAPSSIVSTLMLLIMADSWQVRTQHLSSSVCNCCNKLYHETQLH